MKSQNPGGVAYVSSTVGGSLSTVAFKDNTISKQVHPFKAHSWGIKGPVKGFQG
jgi:hypothetical protein